MPDNFDWQSEQNDDLGDYHEIPEDELRFAPIAEPQPLESDLANEDDVIEENGEPERSFEDLTLAELIGQFFRSPRRTRKAVQTVTRASHIHAK